MAPLYPTAKTSVADEPHTPVSVLPAGVPIDDQVANVVIAQLLFLDSEEPEKDIMLYINSPGGHVSAGLAIYDTMQYLHCDVATICMGQAASMGSFLLAAGTKGKRPSRKSTRASANRAKNESK